MKLNFKEIVEGWRNYLIPPKEMKEHIEQVAQERMEICKACPFMSTNAKETGYTTFRTDEHCTKCGCPLAAKTRSFSSACPMNFWEAILSDEDRYELEKQIKQNEDNKL